MARTMAENASTVRHGSSLRTSKPGARTTKAVEPMIPTSAWDNDEYAVYFSDPEEPLDEEDLEEITESLNFYASRQDFISVMGRLRQRQCIYLKNNVRYQEFPDRHWHGSPTVLALLFTHPDSSAMRQLVMRRDYFDIRTGDTWDLVFAGYDSSWSFYPEEFNELRRKVESLSDGRWMYSGETDLVLVNAWLAECDEPTIDWPSTISGQITDRTAGTTTLTLAGVIERISRDLEAATEDPAYGIAEVTNGPMRSRSHVGRDLMVNALGGIVAALGAHALGA